MQGIDHFTAAASLDRLPLDTRAEFGCRDELIPSGHRRRLDSTLDGLLTLTLNIGIIEGFEKDPADRTVRIDIPACSIPISFVDAIKYLFDCVQHEVRSMTEAA